jgi:hypothetical protein
MVDFAPAMMSHAKDHACPAMRASSEAVLLKCLTFCSRIYGAFWGCGGYMLRAFPNGVAKGGHGRGHRPPTAEGPAGCWLKKKAAQASGLKS